MGRRACGVGRIAFVCGFGWDGGLETCRGVGLWVFREREVMHCNIIFTTWILIAGR